MASIRYSKPFFSDADINKITSCFKNGNLTEGKFLHEYENKIKKFSNCKFSIALNSATSALHLSCLALNLKKNDYLWTSANTFVASSNCALYCGAKVKLIDIDKKTWNMDLNQLEDQLKVSKIKNELPKIVVNVFFAGLPNYPKEIYYLSQKYDFRIIDDASHAFGASFNNEIIGNCKYSDVSIFSTHPVKIFTTCEGGIINTNDKSIYENILILKSHGIQKNKKKFIFKENIDFSWYFEQQALGFNYRLNELEAIVGISQINKVRSFIKKRNEIVKKYINNIDNNLFEFQYIPKGYNSSFHLFVVRAKNYNLKKCSKLFSILKKHKIFVQKHYIPIYKHPYYKNIISSNNLKLLSETEKYYDECISIPLFIGLRDNEIKKISKLLNTNVIKFN